MEPKNNNFLKKVETETDLSVFGDLQKKFFSTRNVVRYSSYQSLALDLYRSITFYRQFRSSKRFLEAFPAFNDCAEDVEELWSEFQSMTDEEISEVAIRIVSDL